MFEQHPEHTRKRILVIITGVVGGVLLLLLIFLYTRPKTSTQENTAQQRFLDFYATILKQTQSFFDQEHAIIKE